MLVPIVLREAEPTVLLNGPSAPSSGAGEFSGGGWEEGDAWSRDRAAGD